MSYKYNVQIKTGDEMQAGTDSNIFIILCGTLGDSAEYRVNGLISGNAFERNETDYFTLEVDEDYGDIYKIKIRSDCSYGGSDWLLDNVKISSQANPSHMIIFPYSQWIDNTEKIEIFASNINKSDIIVKKEITVKSNNIIFVPANVNFTQEDTYRTTVGMKLSEVTATSIATETSVSVSGSMNAITAAIGFVLKTSSSTTTAKEIVSETEVSCKQTLSLQPYAMPRKFRAIYTQHIDEHKISLGDLEMKLPDVTNVTPAGFEEVM